MTQTFIQDFKTGLQFPPARVDYAVLNAGILNYPNVGRKRPITFQGTDPRPREPLKCKRRKTQKVDSLLLTPLEELRQLRSAYENQLYWSYHYRAKASSNRHTNRYFGLHVQRLCQCFSVLVVRRWLCSLCRVQISSQSDPASKWPLSTTSFLNQDSDPSKAYGGGAEEEQERNSSASSSSRGSCHVSLTRRFE